MSFLRLNIECDMFVDDHCYKENNKKYQPNRSSYDKVMTLQS